MPPKAIPDRWIPYKACGAVIEGTRFICFKVPLRASVQKQVPEIKKIWDIQTVLADIPKLGAVIDLTNTERYYNPQDFVKANILHRKILMPGRIIPPESSVLAFMNAVDEFLGKDGESLIGVHCTHGLNRTGYMVCRYMRDRLGIPAQDAITRFEVARGYKIERELYVNGILGKKQAGSVGKNDAEVIPVVSRQHDMTYKSPLDNYRDSSPVDTRNRFGNRPNHDTSDSGKRNGLYSCYTNRYDDRSNPTNTRGDRKRTESPLSWRRRDGNSEDSSRNRSKEKTQDRRNRNEERDRNNRYDRDGKRDRNSNRDRSQHDNSSSGRNRREDRSRTKTDK